MSGPPAAPSYALSGLSGGGEKDGDRTPERVETAARADAHFGTTHVDFRKSMSCRLTTLAVLREANGRHDPPSAHREFRIPGLAGCLSATRDPVGAPVLFARNECAGTSIVRPANVSCSAMFAANRGTAVPVVVQAPVQPEALYS
jgi:hypothetical protein